MSVATIDAYEEWLAQGPVRKLRWRLDLTQQQFAELLGSSKSQVAEWEKGGFFPQYRKVLKIASLEELDPARLVYDIRVWMGKKPRKTI